MRIKSILSEATRNFFTGSNHSLIWFTLFTVLVVLLIGIDQRAVVNQLKEVDNYLNQSGNVHFIASQGNISQQNCVALQKIPGIETAVALRQNDDLELPALPRSKLKSYETTGEFANLFQTNQSIVKPSIFLSADAAGVFKTNPGDKLNVGSEEIVVEAVFANPSDGRGRLFDFSLVTVTNQTTAGFDSCWIKIWPDNRKLIDYLNFAYLGDNTQRPQSQQFNPKFGQKVDVLEAYENRASKKISQFALIAAMVVGVASVLTRRLELASTMHAGVRKNALRLQILFEQLYWLLASAVICAVLLWALSAFGNPQSPWGAYKNGLFVLVSSMIFASLGAQIALSFIKEKHLFRYFKQR